MDKSFRAGFSAIELYKLLSGDYEKALDAAATPSWHREARQREAKQTALDLELVWFVMTYRERGQVLRFLRGTDGADLHPWTWLL